MMTLKRPIFSYLFSLIAFIYTFSVHAAEVATTQTSRTQTTASSNVTKINVTTQIDQLELYQAKMWGLTVEELRRANDLMKGPRGAFSASNISPIEILGINARNDQERRKYAELFARILHTDTENVLAWTQAHADAMARLYPNESVIQFNNSYRPIVDSSIAEAAHVPESAISKPAARMPVMRRSK